MGDISESKAAETTGSMTIACGLCRAKKQKCDRKTPVCSQCAGAPDKCHYPEQNRRGLPAGYLNSLEKRLLDTERALFFALSEIHAGSVEQGRYSDAGRRFMKPSSQSKTELVQGWTQFPLETRDEARSWFLDKQHGASLVAAAPPPGAAPAASGVVPSLGMSSHARGSASLDTTSTENEPWPVGISVPAASAQTPDSSFDLGVTHHVSPQGPWGAFGIETPGIQQNNLMMGQPVYQQHQSASPATSDTRSMPGQLPESSTRARHQGRASIFAKDNENIYF
ncbi:hypothetical protein PFICI_09785 [Pestalotiopsis fici W106-1]|uniref:Zn(2)-C6 fungal-type domain-containing protein n=1 Tax=Pestalotiopsis fici (strain W106-1 / CGMCC3.15140) TaxID=1229662 RepID=W3WV42_PESFW|nr:uncharacterized protein PFICI_09785 [Pestalotiopsis fici W106-1]ETS77723.1 hypothetical protein PFICI_09785 [Pestalotiopsis fici W106-1]